MAIKVAKVPTEGYKYIPLSERSEESPFTVWIKPVSAKQLLTLEDAVVKRGQEGDVTLSAGQFSFNTLKLALVAWDNIEDADGKGLVLRKNMDGSIADESICFIPADIITEIANVVSAISRDPSKTQIFFFEEEEEKEPRKRTPRSKE